MRFNVGQYLMFENKVAKINKIERSKNTSGFTIKLRNFSKGKVERGFSYRGYSYQSTISLDRLNRLYKIKKVKFVAPEYILEVLLNDMERIQYG